MTHREYINPNEFKLANERVIVSKLYKDVDNPNEKDIKDMLRIIANADMYNKYDWKFWNDEQRSMDIDGFIDDIFYPAMNEEVIDIENKKYEKAFVFHGYKIDNKAFREEEDLKESYNYIDFMLISNLDKDSKSDELIIKFDADVVRFAWDTWEKVASEGRMERYSYIDKDISAELMEEDKE